MKTIRLAPRARKTLRHIAQVGANARQVRRAQALLWLDAGERVAEVARRLGVSRPTVYQWIAQYQARQHEPVAQRVCDREHTGRPGTKQQATAAILEQLLEQCPRDSGYRTPVWTVPTLRRETERALGYPVSHDTIRRALHGLGYRYKRPRYVLARRLVHWRQAKGGLNAA